MQISWKIFADLITTARDIIACASYRQEEIHLNKVLQCG